MNEQAQNIRWWLGGIVPSGPPQIESISCYPSGHVRDERWQLDLTAAELYTAWPAEDGSGGWTRLLNGMEVR